MLDFNEYRYRIKNIDQLARDNSVQLAWTCFEKESEQSSERAMEFKVKGTR